MSFDAVLIVAFGGPQGLADVRPFLANVLRGRRVTPERIEEVAHHYELFGGISPLTAWTNRQAELLRERLRDRGAPLPVYVGMRNWHPYLPDTLAEMSRAGVRRAVGFLAAPHRSYSSCTQYRENVEAARAHLRASGLADVEIVYAGDWHTDAGFVEANADHVRDAFARLPAAARGAARLIFTAHSIPLSMAERYPYERQLNETAQAIARLARPNLGEPIEPVEPAEHVELAEPAEPAELVEPAEHVEHVEPKEWTLVYQSRSGRPEDPWLGPDVCDYLRQEAKSGLAGAVLCPIGFLCDHIEVLYDLDVEAAAVARELRLPVVRAHAVNDHPRFIDAMANAVMQTIDRYRRGRPLQIVSGA